MKVLPCPQCSELAACLVARLLGSRSLSPDLYCCSTHGVFFEGDPRGILRMLRTCKRCGHEECPCCQGPGGWSWCDHVECIEDDVEVCPCGDETGGCDYGEDARAIPIVWTVNAGAS